MAKYITWDNGSYKTAVIFDEATEHSRMAMDLYIHKESLIGAGFCLVEVHNGKMLCYGRSESLKTQCNADDTRIVNKVMRIRY